VAAATMVTASDSLTVRGYDHQRRGQSDGWMPKKGEGDEESRADSALLLYIHIPIPFSTFI
jgi:hypothetical protein